MTEEWNPNDPEATRVLYDLGGWSFDQQAELAAELAEAEVPHTWEGSELVVPETHEAQADVLISVLEERLGITYVGDDEGDEDGDEDDGVGARDDGNLARQPHAVISSVGIKITSAIDWNLAAIACIFSLEASRPNWSMSFMSMISMCE